jgi:hypothetical protein
MDFLELIELQIPKKWHKLEKFFTNIFKNIIWHLFDGESNHVVKMTVN